MANGTTIEWTEATWNPVTGCDRVSPGCAHCYALTLSKRLKAMGNPRYQRDGDPRSSGPGFGVTLHEDKLSEPLGWRRPRMVFVNSMSGLFHEQIPDEFVRRVFDVMGRARRHTFQVLTKRPERMRDLLETWAGNGYLPFPNVWLGVSIENRRFVHRADLLRETPAAVRFVSAEPLLGPLIALDRQIGHGANACWSDDYIGPELDLRWIDWLIVGGESGPRHRPIKSEWVRDLRDACVGHGTGERAWPWRPAFFFKQWGGHTPKAGGRELDGRTWDEFPTSTAAARAVA